jgi:hypothetical protein
VGALLHTAGGRGTVGSGDCAFCIVNLAALDFDAGFSVNDLIGLVSTWGAAKHK